MKHTISFISLLGLLFIGLKLSHQIDWSWWLVLLPLYFPFAIFIILFLLVVAYNETILK